MSEQSRIHEISGFAQFIADVPQTRQFSTNTYAAQLNNRATAVHVNVERRF